MKLNSVLGTLPAWVRRRPWLALVVLVGLLALAFVWLQPGRAANGSTRYHEVKRGDFTVSVVEGGTLAAVNEVIIRNEVEGTARIISIVPEGSYVSKGDLLVELDSSQAQDQVNQQRINFEKATFAVEQARAQLEILKSSTNSDFLAAQLKLKFAEIDKQKYVEGQRAVNLIEASNVLVQAESQLAYNEDTYSNSVILAMKGYEMRSKVDQDRLSVQSGLNSVIKAGNSLLILRKFEDPKQLEKLDSDILQAVQELERVISQNERKIAQFEADLKAQVNTLELSRQKLERDERNLKNTRILAPQDGLVVYQVSEGRFSSESLIEGGATVRNRQELIKLPDLSKMKVIVKVHESHINLIQPGLPAFVVLDSMPDRRYAAVVQKVAPLPDTQMRFGNPNLKVYNTEVHLTEAIPDVKPGVSAKAEILITTVKDTVSVPVQAVTMLKGKQVVYVANGSRPEPRQVEVGMFNTKFIEVTKGLEGGERVLLAPPMDTEEKDLEGSVLTAEEKSKVVVTNVPPPTAAAVARRPGGPSQATNGPTGGGGMAVRSPTDRGVVSDVLAPAGGGPNAGETMAGGGGRAGGDGTGRRRGFNREEMLKQYDKNGDGELDETEQAATREAMAARFGGQGGPGGPGMGGINREEMLKQYDKNGDGELDESERAAMREAMAARFGRQGGPGGSGMGGGNREEMLKRFDKNGDGELDESERAAMREAVGESRGGQGGQRGTGEGGAPNNPPGGSPGAPGGSR